MINKDDILKAYNSRHACKLFDDSKKIPKEDMEFILETARLSPSSFGMEHWHILNITNEDLRKELKPVCWDQAQITSCSNLLILLAKKDMFEGSSEYVEQMFNRRGLSPEHTKAYIAKYTQFVEARPSKIEWSQKQCYIAGANMATTAAMLGVDSCFIEGFEKEKVEKVLGIDTTKEELAFILALGYKANETTPKFRLPIEQVVTNIE